MTHVTHQKMVTHLTHDPLAYFDFSAVCKCTAGVQRQRQKFLLGAKSFPSRLSSPLHPFLSRRSMVPEIQRQGLGERCKLPSGVWGRAPEEIDVGDFSLKIMKSGESNLHLIFKNYAKNYGRLVQKLGGLAPLSPIADAATACVVKS